MASIYRFIRCGETKSSICGSVCKLQIYMTMMKAFATIICRGMRIKGIDPDKPFYENFDKALFNLPQQNQATVVY